MHHAFRALIVCVALAGVSGCGDSPAGLIHEMLVFWNEVCDNTLRVTDDKTALDIINTQFKILDKKREDIKERANKAMGTYDKKEQFEELLNSLLDSYDEVAATEKRVNKCKERLVNMGKAGGQNNNILAVVKRIDEWKDFNNTSLGNFTPNSLDPKAPKQQVGKGLIMPWPQREKTATGQGQQAPPQDPPNSNGTHQGTLGKITGDPP